MCVAGLTQAAGPGIQQVKWSGGEVGREVVTFSNNTVGPQPTIADFQHGWLYIGAARSVDNSRQGVGSWWDVSNPRQPTLTTQKTIFNNKPHMLTFWEDKMLDGHQASRFLVWDFDDHREIASVNGSVGPVWYMGQIPYVYRPRNGYGAGPNRLDIIRLNPQSTGGDLWAQYDLGSAVSFPVGALHAVGNLLIASASQASGVATFDISNPTQPVLLDQVITGGQVYTSMVHGSRVYQCEQNNSGVIRVYDFSNPADIQTVGTVFIGNNPRYVMLKDGKGYCAPGTNRLVRFDAQSRVVDRDWRTGGGMDFVQLIGNMAITGGMEGLARCALIPIQTEPDTTGPAVGFVSPANGTVNQALSSRVGFIMSDQIDVTSLNSQTFIVRPIGSSDAVAGTYSTQLGMINFSPAESLLPGTTYEVILPAGGLRDTVGNAIGSQWRSVFTTTGSPPGGGGGGGGGLDPNAVGGHLAHWEFNRQTQFGFDSSLNGRTLQLQQGAAFSTDAREGPGALALNGSNQFAVSSDIALGDAFTLAAWIRMIGGSASRAILSNTTDAGGADGFRFCVASDGSLQFVTGDGSGSVVAVSPGGTVPAYQWVHVAVSVNRTLGIVSLFRNRELVYNGSQLHSGFRTSGIIAVGASTNGKNLFGGSMDDIQILPRASTGSAIRGVPGEERFLHARFEGAQGNEFVRDWALGDLYEGTLWAGSGPSVSYDAVEGSQSARFPLGHDDILESFELFTEAGEFTWLAWLKPDVWSGERTVGGTDDNEGSLNGFVIAVDNPGSGGSRLLLWTGNGRERSLAASQTGAIPAGQWVHCAVTLNRATGVARLYVNGLDVTASSAARSDYSTFNFFGIGQDYNGGNDYSGLMDDVRVYTRVLDGAAIAAMAGVQNRPPSLQSFELSTTQIETGQTLNATASASDPDALDSVLYSFTFDDASSATGFSASGTAAATFNLAGRRFVSVRATDGVAVSTERRLAIVHHPLTDVPPARSSLLICDRDRNALWAANPDGDSVCRIDGATLSRDFEVSVGDEPRSLALRPDGSEIWVACAGSSEVAILDAGTGAVLGNLPMGYGSRPSAIVFAPDGSAAFAALQGAGAVLRIDPATRAIEARTAVAGEPNALAVAAGAPRLFATRFLSPETRGEVHELDADTLAPVRTLVLAYDTSTDTESSSAGVPNYLMQAAIGPDGRQMWVPSKKDNVQRGLSLNGKPLTHDSTVRSILSRIDLTTGAEISGARLDINDQGFPAAVCFSPAGDLAFAAFITNDEVLVFDTATGNALAGVETGHAPHALCLGPDGAALYVLNFLSRSVQAFDVTGLATGASSEMPLLGEVSIASVEPLSPEVLAGKRVFYHSGDARMAGDGYMTCISCHLDGRHDGRVWDGKDLGEGLRNTITLLGRAGMAHGRVHWSGNFDEIQDFEHDMRNRFGGSGFLTAEQFESGSTSQPLGDPKTGLNADLDALAAYVASLDTAPPSPHRMPDGSLSESAREGARHYAALNCMECHRGAAASDSPSGLLHDVGTLKASSGERLGGPLTGIDTPTLKALWASAPYLHDGSAANLADVFSESGAPEGSPHAAVRGLSPQEQAELLDYLLQFDERESDTTLAGFLELLPPDANREPGADPNGDGFDNLATYAFGRSARDGEGLAPVRPGDILRVSASGGVVELPFDARHDIAYSLEYASGMDSGTWRKAAVKARGGAWKTTGAVPGLVVVSVSSAGLTIGGVPGGKSGFWRVRIQDGE